MIRAFLLVLGMSMLLATSALAVQPNEVLEDPVLEERARDLSKGLRCLVCRNESIDESNAELARDLRLLVRERLVAGDTDEEVIDFVVDRYGEYVLLNPRTDGSNLILWIAGPVMLLGAVLVAAYYVRSNLKRRETPPEALSDSESERLDEILKQ